MIKNTLFYQNLSKNKDKLKLFERGIATGQIQEFDHDILSKLNKIFYGGIPSTLYLYGFPTSFDTVGNKAEIMTHILGEYDYNIVHADIDSTREIHFNLYNQKYLDYNTWVEVNIGNKTWIYDLFSMLKIEKELYNKLENPTITKVVSKELIESHPARQDDDFTNLGDNFSSLIIIPAIESYLKYNPYKDFVEQDLRRWKNKIDYEKLQFEWLEEQEKFGTRKK